jgi:PAS domain S-box-containing protein
MEQKRPDNFDTPPTQSAELFNLIVENIKDYAVFMTDPAGRLVSWNPGVERLLGYTESEFVGQSGDIIFTPEDVAAGVPVKEMQSARANGAAEDKRWHRRKDDSRFWANGMMMSLKNEDGSLRGFAKVMRDETAQRLADEKLEGTKRRVENILESITDAFFALDHDWRFIYLNPQSEQLLRRRRSELLGKIIWHEFPEAVGTRFDENYRKAVSEQSTVVFEDFYPPLDAWFEVRAYPSEEGLSVYFHNIDERKRTEEDLRKSEERYRMLFTSIDEGFCVVEVIFDENQRAVDYRFLEFNPAFEKQTGLKNAVGRTIREFTPNHEEFWFEIYGKIALTGEAVRFEHRAAALNRWYDVYAFRIGDPAENKVAIIFNDILEKKRAENEREKLFGSEREARAQAEKANRLKDEFLATLSHELRTPLNSILGWSQMLQNGNFGEKQREKALSIIERNARSQSQLIDDILDVSRIVTGKLRLSIGAVDLPEVIMAAVDAAGPAAEAKHIRVQTFFDPRADQISGDPDRIQQVVWNLLSNAIKFTPKDGQVQVRLERVHSHVEIVVIDTGVGIEPEFLPFVFDRFRQSDASTTRRQGGLGLGLAIVRQLVELHGGTVSVESRGQGHGATFTVKLPLLPLRTEPESEAPPSVHPAAQTNESPNCPPELSGLRVLLVDDEPDSRDLLNFMLESCGAEVAPAASAAEAFKLIRSEKFDVVVSDIGMPDEDGYSLIRKIRDLPDGEGGNVPAIALTAYARAEDRVRAIRSGFQMHIAKPVEPAELIAVVANLTGKIRKPHENG